MRNLSVRFGILILMLSAALLVDGAPVHARRSTASIFAVVDTDRDGTIDAAEARQTASALFDRLDTDNDGSLDANELQGHISKEELQSW